MANPWRTGKKINFLFQQATVNRDCLPLQHQMTSTTSGIITEQAIIWVGILLCLVQSALFSGLNLAFFSLTRLRLEVEVASNNTSAVRVLAMREDANFLLTTILWGNVGINVLLTLLSDSVLVGTLAFLFSVIVITLFGEILPQAFFSRNALRMASLFAPLLRFYQILLYPVAKPSAWALDTWLGKEGVTYWRERDLKQFILEHIGSTSTEVSHAEGTGAINFLTIDDLPLVSEGADILESNVISLDEHNGELLFPKIAAEPGDPFLKQLALAKQPWIILTNRANEPKLVVKADTFLRNALLSPNEKFDPRSHCHTPILIDDAQEPLVKSIIRLKRQSPLHSDEPIQMNPLRRM